MPAEELDDVFEDESSLEADTNCDCDCDCDADGELVGCKECMSELVSSSLVSSSLKI